MTHTHAVHARRLLLGAAILLAAVFVTVVYASPALAADSGGLNSTVTLPVGWGPVIAGLIVSALTTLTTRASAPGWLKVVVAITLSAIAAIVEQLTLSGWTFVPAELGMTFLMVWVWQLLAYFGFTKPVLQPVLAPQRGITAAPITPR